MVILVYGLFFTNLLAAQQPYLYLNKIGRTLKVTFEAGESIRFRLMGDDYFSKGTITRFGDDFIKINDTQIPLRQIERIDIRNKNFSMFSFRSTPGKLAFAGYGYVFLDWFNRHVVFNEESVQIDKNVLYAALGLQVTSYLLKILRKKYFRPLKSRSTLAIINPPE